MYRGRDTLAAPIRPNQITEPEVPRHPPRTFIQDRLNSDECRHSAKAQDSSLKGGDPAAGSPTATLLRLHPSR